MYDIEIQHFFANSGQTSVFCLSAFARKCGKFKPLYSLFGGKHSVFQTTLPPYPPEEGVNCFTLRSTFSENNAGIIYIVRKNVLT